MSRANDYKQIIYYWLEYLAQDKWNLLVLVLPSEVKQLNGQYFVKSGSLTTMINLQIQKISFLQILRWNPHPYYGEKSGTQEKENLIGVSYLVYAIGSRVF